MRSVFPKPLAQMQVDRILAQAKHDARQHSGLEDYGAAEVSSPVRLNAERLEHPMEKVLFLEELEKVVHVSTSKSPNSLAVFPNITFIFSTLLLIPASWYFWLPT